MPLVEVPGARDIRWRTDAVAELAIGVDTLLEEAFDD
jgi:hypothetical protein|tara:strand:+ start:5831 stop:5941 length:111 start_codon:yes stop_codon:yes gene_type:complete